MTVLSMILNERRVDVDVVPEMPLLWVLRDELGLHGTRYGCGRGLCGACTVHVDGSPARSCQICAADIKQQKITTIEGVFGRIADAVRVAWKARDVAQCGYCQSGQMMSAIALLTTTPHPTDDDIDREMSGNICRCNTYHRIRAAIKDAAHMIGRDHA